MFLGKYYGQILDNKLQLPPRFDKLFLSRSVCILGFDDAHFSIYKAEEYPAEELPGLYRDAIRIRGGQEDDFSKIVIVASTELTNDGLLTVPQSITSLCNFRDTDVVFIGAGDKIDVWCKQTWDEVTDPNDENAQIFLQKLSKRYL